MTSGLMRERSRIAASRTVLSQVGTKLRPIAQTCYSLTTDDFSASESDEFSPLNRQRVLTPIMRIQARTEILQLSSAIQLNMGVGCLHLQLTSIWEVMYSDPS